MNPNQPVPRFKFDGPELHLYPLVCMHIGAQQCDVKFIREHIARIKNDPHGRAVYLGDGGECVTKLSKGDLYGAQILSPQHQLDFLVELLQPIKDKMLFAIRGNHGHRVYKESGLSWDQNFAHRMGVPYLGVGTFAHFLVNRSPYTAYFHHGTDSGVGLKSKIQAAENFARFIDADAIFTAHSHVAEDLTPAPILSVEDCRNGEFRSRTKMRSQYICGTAYDSRTGYAEDKAYPPLLPAYLMVAFDGRIREGHAVKGQQVFKWRSTGDYDLNHDYVTDFINRRGE